MCTQCRQQFISCYQELERYSIEIRVYPGVFLILLVIVYLLWVGSALRFQILFEISKINDTLDCIQS